MPTRTQLLDWNFGIGSRSAHARPSVCRTRKGSTIAEFGPALFIFLFFALFPAIDLMAVAMGTASISLAAKQGASAAASSADYGAALTAMEREVNSVRSSGFGAFLNLRPVGGSNGCGANLYITKTNVANQAVEHCGPNQKAPTPLDATAFIYEYQCNANFQVGPWCNLSGVPFIGSVPGLGPPAQIRYNSAVAVEYPEGLTAGAPSTGSWSSSAAF